MKVYLEKRVLFDHMSLHQNKFEKHLKLLVLLEACLLGYKERKFLTTLNTKNNYQEDTMPSKENRPPEDHQDLRLRQLRARRAHLTARLRRIRELETVNRLLREQLLFLQQLLEEEPENLEGETNGDEKQTGK